MQIFKGQAGFACVVQCSLTTCTQQWYTQIHPNLGQVWQLLCVYNMNYAKAWIIP